MTKTNIIATLRIILSLAIAGPAQAWPGQSSSVDCAWGNETTDCEALAMALVRKHAPARSNSRKAERAVMPFSSSRLPDHDEDPLASMHFE
ncbi:hypothetical protein [Bradyrhizobium guangzhouense]|uniref:Uncharacterized protein n=1 Tax=Bradyrhizobium guangzhouense TaxID=1325095 RepID=A0AAE5WYX5_9BRAD|nr:hypothetical protein [Bradyrhizobium guangzhouense]QAU45722.1 hypothetical protein XH91_10350 [Bradyrhizobium guangzhouense]RXH08058.1 hypothetical protein EAS56_30510 [Bradyrhizobium guangzhouense]